MAGDDKICDLADVALVRRFAALLGRCEAGDAKWTVNALRISTLEVSDESSEPAPMSGFQLASKHEIKERQHISQRCLEIVYNGNASNSCKLFNIIYIKYNLVD